MDGSRSEEDGGKKKIPITVLSPSLAYNLLLCRFDGATETHLPKTLFRSLLGREIEGEGRRLAGWLQVEPADRAPLFFLPTFFFVGPDLLTPEN